MTTGNKFSYQGLGASDRALVLSKEAELLDLEIRSHREILSQLRHVQDVTRMTTEQAKAVAAEVAWRINTIRHQHALKRQKRDSVAKWKVRQWEARVRMERAQAGREMAVA